MCFMRQIDRYKGAAGASTSDRTPGGAGVMAYGDVDIVAAVLIGAPSEFLRRGLPAILLRLAATSTPATSR